MDPGPRRFNHIAQSLAADCVALAPATGADDLPGVEAAVGPDICRPPRHPARCRPLSLTASCDQGLTLIHFSAQRKRFLWDRGGI